MRASPTLLATFAENLHRLRLARGLSQVNLAKRSGLTQAGISQLEGKERMPSLRSIARLSEALAVTWRQLLQPVQEHTLSRERADRIARAIVHGTVGDSEGLLAPRERAWVDQVGALVIQKLRAHGVSGKIRYARSRWQVAQRMGQVSRRFGREAVQQVLQRVDALLAMGIR